MERPCDQQSARFCRVSMPWAQGFPVKAYGAQDPVDCSKDHNYVAIALNTIVTGGVIFGVNRRITTHKVRA